jgi:hypothetical protein
MARRNGGTPKPNAERIRGLTKAEYQAVCRMVRRGETTWDALERAGIALPAQNESNFRRRVREVLTGGVSIGGQDGPAHEAAGDGGGSEPLRAGAAGGE